MGPVSPSTGGTMRSREELLKLLDLAGKEAPAEPSDVIAPLTSAEPSASDSLSPTALELDEWALRKGRELLAESEQLRELEIGAEAAADFHGAAFEPEPKLLPGCSDPLRHRFV